MVTAKDVEEARFGLAEKGRIGYEETAVDAFLDRVVETLAKLDATGHVPPGGVTSTEVVETVFAECPDDQAAGYDLDEVDDLLDRVAQRLFAYEQQSGTATERIGDDRPAVREREDYAVAPAPELVDERAYTDAPSAADDAEPAVQGEGFVDTDSSRGLRDDVAVADDGFRDSRSILHSAPPLAAVDGADARTVMSEHAVDDHAGAREMADADDVAADETGAGQVATTADADAKNAQVAYAATDETVGLVGGEPIEEAEQAHSAPGDHVHHAAEAAPPQEQIHRVGEEPQDVEDRREAHIADSATADGVAPVAHQPGASETTETVETVEAPHGSPFAEPGVRAGEVGWRGDVSEQGRNSHNEIVGVPSPNGYPVSYDATDASAVSGDNTLAEQSATPNSEPRAEAAAGASAPVEAGPVEDATPVRDTATPIFEATDDHGAGFAEPGTVIRSEGSSQGTNVVDGNPDTNGTSADAGVNESDWVDSRTLAAPAAPVASPVETAAVDAAPTVAPTPEAGAPSMSTFASTSGSTMGTQWNQVSPDAPHPPSEAEGSAWTHEVPPAAPAVQETPVAPATSPVAPQEEVISYPATEHRVPLPRTDARRQLTDEDIEAQSNYHPEYSEYAPREGYETVPPSVAPSGSALPAEPAPQHTSREAAAAAKDASVTPAPGEISNVQHLQGQEQVGQEGQAGHGDSFGQAQVAQERWSLDADANVPPVGRPEPIDAPQPIDTPREVPTREEGEKPKGFLRRLFKG